MCTKRTALAEGCALSMLLVFAVVAEGRGRARAGPLRAALCRGHFRGENLKIWPLHCNMLA